MIFGCGGGGIMYKNVPLVYLTWFFHVAKYHWHLFILVNVGSALLCWVPMWNLLCGCAIVVLPILPTGVHSGSFQFASINATTVNILENRSFMYFADYFLRINSWI